VHTIALGATHSSPLDTDGAHSTGIASVMVPMSRHGSLHRLAGVVMAVLPFISLLLLGFRSVCGESALHSDCVGGDVIELQRE
jgi:hypothetical protein